MGNDLEIWTIYEKPIDYPKNFVARKFTVKTGKVVIDEGVLLADSLDDIREKLPPNLTQLARHENDDPVIVETWF